MEFPDSPAIEAISNTPGASLVRVGLTVEVRVSMDSPKPFAPVTAKSPLVVSTNSEAELDEIQGKLQRALDAGLLPHVKRIASIRTLLPADASLHFVMADAVFAVADYHFAAFLIGEGLRLEPGLARAETDKRLLYSKPETFEEQMAALRRYIDSKPYDAMAQLVLAYNLKRMMQIFGVKPLIRAMAG